MLPLRPRLRVNGRLGGTKRECRKARNMRIDGRCHCGYITYEAEIEPEKVMICHCTDCQTLSGSVFRTIAFTREGTFKLLSGELKVYGRKRDKTPPIVLSGMRNTDLFEHHRRWTQSPRYPGGHHPSARSACSESAALVPVLAGLVK